ncbi:hypothetical protein EJ04DRAFT_163942 [Polyplosphaeria fusca]|uniref:Uncharacterized protein n=1 Tax=Polyplosphaeria fusca TaxID=682080 RepID=A0A9P4R9S6_9PLEO|nr:hypothetical protein EJ04DRAFT_163942 [Polyplosphaeria fusca]
MPHSRLGPCTVQRTEANTRPRTKKNTHQQHKWKELQRAMRWPLAFLAYVAVRFSELRQVAPTAFPCAKPILGILLLSLAFQIPISPRTALSGPKHGAPYLALRAIDASGRGGDKPWDDAHRPLTTTARQGTKTKKLNEDSFVHEKKRRQSRPHRISYRMSSSTSSLMDLPNTPTKRSTPLPPTAKKREHLLSDDKTCCVDSPERHGCLRAAHTLTK